MILITGGTGRIGRHLLERLASNPSNRIRLFARKKPNFPLPQNVSVFVGDLSNEVDIRAALSGVSEVVHLAGLVAFHLPRQVLETVNVGHTERLAKCAADAHVHAFIHASSITVYGKGVDGLLVDEGTPPCPTNAYGVSKLASERSVLGFSKTMHVCILRLGVVYGEGISVGYGKMLLSLQKGRMKIIGKGDNRIPFVHVSDVCQAFELALSNQESYPSGSVFNITSEELTQKEIIGIASEGLGVKSPTNNISKSLALFLANLKIWLSKIGVGNKESASLLAEMLEIIGSDRQISFAKAQKILGYSPKVGIRQGILQVVGKFKKGELAQN